VVHVTYNDVTISVKIVIGENGYIVTAYPW